MSLIHIMEAHNLKHTREVKGRSSFGFVVCARASWLEVLGGRCANFGALDSWRRCCSRGLENLKP